MNSDNARDSNLFLKIAQKIEWYVQVLFAVVFIIVIEFNEL